MTICNLDGVNPLRQEFMENECEALPGVAYPGVRDNRSTVNTKTGYDDDDDDDDDVMHIRCIICFNVFYFSIPCIFAVLS